MPAGSGAKRQLEPILSNETQPREATLKDFACEACGGYKVRLTERESWYRCANCGYSFGIEPNPKKRMRRATDIGSGPISH